MTSKNPLQNPPTTTRGMTDHGNEYALALSDGTQVTGEKMMTLLRGMSAIELSCEAKRAVAEYLRDTCPEVRCNSATPHGRSCEISAAPCPGLWCVGADRMDCLVQRSSTSSVAPRGACERPPAASQVCG